MSQKRFYHDPTPKYVYRTILLGMFMYVREVFFLLVGGTDTDLAKEINGLAHEIGLLFAHQSDRSMPKTQFWNGISGGKISAKEYTGVLLVLLVILRSTKGRELLKTRKRTEFGHDEGLDRWAETIELLLLWEKWLKSDTMAQKLVHRAKKKHCYIIYLLKRILKKKGRNGCSSRQVACYFTHGGRHREFWYTQ